MGQYKHKERAEAYRLYVEEGVHDMQELAERSGLSRATVRTVITPDATKEYVRRCREAKRLYVDRGMTDVGTICAQAGIHLNLWTKLYTASWDEERAKHVADNPVNYRTAQLLQQAAEQLLLKVQSKEYDGQDVNELVKLTNAFEKFKTGEFKLESILMGIEDFASWFFGSAADLGVSAAEARALARVVNRYKVHILERLRLMQ